MGERAALRGAVGFLLVWCGHHHYIAGTSWPQHESEHAVGGAGDEKIILTGVTDTHYNGTFTMAGFGAGQTTVTYGLNCSGVTNVGAGGTLSAIPGKAVKNAGVYECTGASCALPANAANYSLVGVAEGIDGYFVDKGWAITAASVDIGYPATPPTAAVPDWLDTTITAGGGTTSLTLATAATNSVTSAGAWHDNVPNLYAACAALPSTTSASNPGYIYTPAPSTYYQFFPIIANFDMTGSYGQNPRNCPAGTTIQFGASTYMDGAILPGKGNNFIGGFGSTNCGASFYQLGTTSCMSGYSFPMFYFEPEQASGNNFENLVLLPNNAGQSGLYIDAQMNGDGTTGVHYKNFHVNGGTHSLPVVFKAGFGHFWDYGGFSNVGGNFSESRDFLVQPNCGSTGYLGPQIFPYIVTTNNTYSFGTFQVDACGLNPGVFGGGWTINNMLTEGPAGPALEVQFAALRPIDHRIQWRFLCRLHRRLRDTLFRCNGLGDLPAQISSRLRALAACSHSWRRTAPTPTMESASPWGRARVAPTSELPLAQVCISRT